MVRNVLALAIALVTGCGGSARSVTTPPPPPRDETLDVKKPTAQPPDDDADGVGGAETTGELRSIDDDRVTPNLAAGAGPVSDKMSASEISSVMKRNAKQLKNCYLTELAKKPELKGRVVAQFTIGRDGKVTRASASGIDPEVEACVQRIVEALTFTPTGSESKVSFPLIFSSPN
ncbi:MAG: AgmX/PglI C-terminal domain-containing protein [Deltaproteobacteria bacterium]|nr:AgmX/PglI C-terminal domain-containing protein [Deltaproteobacteria bacterium]MCW5801725.1 AgmX/PglI C-terminal domain-containing protein [Deltaproteobacteria bacterium]